MTYKNIFRTALLTATLATAATSCSFEQEDFFDESASLRITHLNEQLKQQLVDQSSADKNGWVIQYFVAGTDDYNFEGFNLFGRFYQSGKVTLASNHRYLRNGNANKYTEHTSTYDLLAEEGPVLSFNTWNDILTVFEDPVSPTAAPNTLSSDGEGMNGDHNLVLSAYSDDELLFRGERHSAQVRFVPCDRPWEEYIEAVSQLKNTIATNTLTSYYVTNGVDTMFFSGLNRGVFNYCDRVYDPLNNKTLSCVFTPNGFRLNHVDSLGTYAFQEFTLDADTTCLLSADGSVKVIPTWDTYMAEHSALWKFDVTKFTTEQQSLYDQIAVALKQFSNNYELESISIGTSSGRSPVNGIVLNYYSNARHTTTNTAGIALDITCPTYGQITLADSSEEFDLDGNMLTISNRVEAVETLVRQFISTLLGTYDVTPDNYFLPTGGSFAPVAGGTAFKLN